MVVYLRQRPLSVLSVVHASIPLRLPLRPLVPAKATEGVEGWLLLRECRTVPCATIGAACVLLLRILIGTAAVVATAALRQGKRDIIAGCLLLCKCRTVPHATIGAAYVLCCGCLLVP